MLAAVFADVGIETPQFDENPATRAKQAAEALRGAAGGARAKMHGAASEIDALANPLGEDCIRQVAGADRAEIVQKFLSFDSSQDRVAWVRRARPDIFYAAQSLWFFERRANSKKYADAFEAPDGVEVSGDVEVLEARIAAIVAADVGEPPRVRVERHELEDGATLFSISHEELWTTEPEFNEDDELDARAHRIVHHAAVKIEEGVVTVTTERGGKLRRDALCSAVAQEVLGLSSVLGRLPPLIYNLQRLLSLEPFRTDPAHRISDVRVTALNLRSPSLGDAFSTVYTTGKNPTDVRERTRAQLSAADLPLATVEAGELRVIFEPGPERHRRRVVRLSFSGSTGCKFQLDCAEEALVRSVYLKQWDLIGRRASFGKLAR